MAMPLSSSFPFFTPATAISFVSRTFLVLTIPAYLLSNIWLFATAAMSKPARDIDSARFSGVLNLGKAVYSPYPKVVSTLPTAISAPLK